MNKLIKLVLSFLSILTLALAISLISAQGTTTVSLADFEANPASTIKAPLMIYNVTDVAGGELNTSFDPSVVHVTDISEGDIGTTMSNINNEAGWAYMNVFGVEGKSGGVVFAYLTLKAVGSEGEKSSLNISVISLFNTSYEDITFITDNGTFVVKTAPTTPTPSPCFIATAAYGTPLHEDIDALRAFRDKYLMTNPIGRTFVKIYYTTSPPTADAIRENEGLRTIVRDGLVKPLVYLFKKYLKQ